MIRYWSWGLIVFFVLWLATAYLFLPNLLALTEQNWPYIILGFCGAVLGNISAVGGGIVFIPAIIFLFHLPPVTALKIALTGQSFGMSSGAIGWLQRKQVPLKLLKLTLPGLLVGV